MSCALAGQGRDLPGQGVLRLQTELVVDDDAPVGQIGMLLDGIADEEDGNG